MSHVARTTQLPVRARRRRALAPAAALAAAALGLAACGSSGRLSRRRLGQRQADHRVRRVRAWAPRAQQTQTAINAFEKANPNIKVKIDVLSSELDDLPVAAGALVHRRLDHARRVRVGRHLPGQVRPGRLGAEPERAAPGHGPVLPDRGRRRARSTATPYAVPWFDNPEGLYYRTDLIKTPPTSPAQVVSDAQAAHEGRSER